MSNPFVSRVGGTLSADIAVPEHEREVRFYSRVLGTGENPLWREDLMNNRGTPIIGLGPRSPEYADLPLQWMPHIQVADVAASAERALDLGGHEAKASEVVPEERVEDDLGVAARDEDPRVREVVGRRVARLRSLGAHAAAHRKGERAEEAELSESQEDSPESPSRPS